jgi:glycosyltransferase involved in cell wall biosynthesis
VASIAPRAHIEILPNYVAIPPARPSNSIAPTKCTFFFSGQICPRKGIFDLIPAFRLVRAANPNVELRIAGDGELQRAINLARDLDVAAAVTFLGWLPLHQGLPMSMLEAMAAGLPVLTTPVGGIPEVVDHGVNGLIADAGDIRSIADQMLRLANDPDLRTMLGKAGRETIEQGYSAEVQLPRLERIYQQLL